MYSQNYSEQTYIKLIQMISRQVRVKFMALHSVEEHLLSKFSEHES